LCELIGADAVAAGDMRPPGCRSAAPPVVAFVSDPCVHDPVACAAVERRWREHPLLARHLARPVREVIKVTDFLSDRQWRRRAVYRDGYRRMGLTYEMTVALAWAPEGTTCVALHRADRDFAERDRELLARVAPHARAAHERIAATAAGERVRALLERGLSDHGEQPVVVGHDDAIVAATPGAAELLATWFPATRRGRLPDAIAEWRAARRGAPRPGVFARHDGGRRLTLRLVAGETEDLLLVCEPPDAPPDPDALRRALPVTRRQAEVLTLLAAGRTNAQIAHDLAISAHTVGRHVEAIYRGLGVRTRAAATAAAFGAVARPDDRSA
jgi:DNA-binding CsgD family transcriptional regulator